jgi:hypothetical protein
MSVSTDPTFTFLDPFDSTVIDTTNRWTTGGTVAPTQNGAILVNPGTTANATSAIVSQPTFIPNSNTSFGCFIMLEATTIATGNYRFWGYGTAPSGVGTAAAPIQDGVGFEVDTSGVLRASTYSGGTRVFTQILSAVTDGASHLYVINSINGTALFYRDTFTTPIASASIASAPNTQTLPLRIVSLNGASTTTGTPTLSGQQIGVADSTHQASGISDGVYYWRKATVKAASAAAVAADPALVVTLSPNNGVTGFTAAAATASGNPVRGGSVGKTSNPTAVTDGQVTNNLADKLGKIISVGSIRDLKANQITTITTTTETTIATAVASTFLDLYGLIITNTSSTTVNVAIKDATAGTTRLNLSVPANDTRGFMLPEGGAIKQAVVNNNWTATSSSAVSSLIITALTVQNL